MSQPGFLTNQLLIAMPSMADPNFAQTVTLICEHSARGALGLVLNRPLPMKLSDVFEQLSLDAGNLRIGERAVLRGGPVQTDRGFVIHRPGVPAINHDSHSIGHSIGHPVGHPPGHPISQPIGNSPVGKWDSTLKVSDRIQVTTSRDILAAMARGEGPPDAFIALGYAGWDAGQLEQEMLGNTWLSMPADERVIFDLPYEDRWQAAFGFLGVDLTRISTVAGHA